MKLKRVLLDMDCVLVDFVGGVARRWGMTTSELHQHWEPGVWDIVPPLARAVRQRNGKSAEVLTEDRFWAMLDRSEMFWARLEPCPWLKELVALVKSITDDWHIISAPSKCQSSYSGKVKWLKSHFGYSFDRFALTPHKHIFAQPDVLLIDDRDSNVEGFVEAGGDGIVFPAYHNRLHLVDDPMEHINLMLGSLLCT